MKRLILPVFFLAISFCPSVAINAQELGIAEVYPSSLVGKMTSSGTAYNPQRFTAAHKIHAIGTRLKVTRTDESAHRSTIVTVSDRGPYTSGHIVVLSRAAAKSIGMDENSTASVIVEVLPPDNPTIQAPSKKEDLQASKVNPGKVPAPSGIRQAPSDPVAPNANNNLLTAKGGQVPPVQGNLPELSLTNLNNGTYEYGLYKIAQPIPQPQGYAVQVMCLSHSERALEQMAVYQKKGFRKIMISIQPGGGFNDDYHLYKIILGGPFSTIQQAQVYAGNLKKKYKINGFVVNLSELTY